MNWNLERADVRGENISSGGEKRRKYKPQPGRILLKNRKVREQLEH